MENRKMHVLVVATWYPIGWDKLIGIYHKHFCQALAENGTKVNMIFVDRQPISALHRYPFMKKYYELPDDSGYITYCQRMLNVSRISFDLQMQLYTKKLEILYRKYEAIHGKPDVIHAQVTVPAGYAACVLGKKLGIPVVVTEHASFFQRFFQGKEEKYARYVTQNAAKITFVTSYMGEGFREAAGIQGQVLPNIVDCSHFSSPKNIDSSAPLQFLSVCALRPGKQIHIAAQALKILKDAGKLPPFHYTVVGDGDTAVTYKNLVDQMGMSDYVDFVGTKDRAEIAQLLRRTHILLLPSQLETFGIPAVEALAAGVPVVSTKCKGPETFLTPECSELCEVNDPQSMADAIDRMVKRLPELDEAALRAVAAQFDSASVAALACKYYREALDK